MTNTINKAIKSLCVIALFGVSASLSAQEENTNLNREMTLEREYDPSVQDANKVNTLPEVKEPEVKKTPIDYSDITLSTSPAKEVEVLPSGDILAHIDYNKKRGYLNLGAGTYLNLNGDLGYRIINTAKDQLGFAFSHRSMNGNLKYLQFDEEKIKAKFNDNLGGLNYSHIFEKAILNLGANYGYSSFNYYGWPVPPFTPPASSIATPTDRETNQVAQTIQANAGVQSVEGSRVGYSLNLDYTNFSYKYGEAPSIDGPTEHSIGVKGDMNTEIGTDQRVGLSANLNYFSYGLPDEMKSPSGVETYDTEYKSYAEIGVSPYYQVSGGNWNINLGANLFYITRGDSKFMVTPNVMADVTIAGNTVLYGAATGQVQSNSMYGVSRMHRYVDPSQAIAPTRHQLNSVIGIKSGVIPGFWFDLFGGYNIMKDDILLVPRIAANEGFGNLSESLGDVDFNHTFFGASIKYSYQKYFDVFLKGVYNKADIKQPELDAVGFPEIPPFGRPKIEINASLTVRPIEKLSVAFDFNYAKDRCTLLYGEVMPLDNIQELNITGSYAFNDTFGFYAKLNNLLFQKYDLYYGYPAQGFNIMAGINLNF